MTEPHTLERSDEDILGTIHELVRSYQPFYASHRYFHVAIKDGVVILEGHLRSMRARRLLVHQVGQVEDVVAVDDSRLYDDETLRFEIGKLLPEGTRVRISHGAVVLTGSLPQEVALDKLKGRIAEHPGVRDILTDF